MKFIISILFLMFSLSAMGASPAVTNEQGEMAGEGTGPSVAGKQCTRECAWGNRKGIAMGGDPISYQNGAANHGCEVQQILNPGQPCDRSKSGNSPTVVSIEPKSKKKISQNQK